MGDNLRDQDKDNKKTTTENYEYSMQKSGSVVSSKNTYDLKVKATNSKSQGSVSTAKTYPTFPTCGKNHPGECLAGKEGCFGCGHPGH